VAAGASELFRATGKLRADLLLDCERFRLVVRIDHDASSARAGWGCDGLSALSSAPAPSTDERCGRPEAEKTPVRSLKSGLRENGSQPEGRRDILIHRAGGN